MGLSSSSTSLSKKSASVWSSGEKGEEESISAELDRGRGDLLSSRVVDLGLVGWLVAPSSKLKRNGRGERQARRRRRGLPAGRPARQGSGSESQEVEEAGGRSRARQPTSHRATRGRGTSCSCLSLSLSLVPVCILPFSTFSPSKSDEDLMSFFLSFW
jgi:hypothetical protein